MPNQLFSAATTTMTTITITTTAISSLVQLKGSVKEPNMSIYFFFLPTTQWCSISDFCLMMEGECQILVF